MSKLFNIALLSLDLASKAIIYNSETRRKSVGSPESYHKPSYNLPLWKVGKHTIHAKNANDALKYIKKRGLWDGKSSPVLCV